MDIIVRMRGGLGNQLFILAYAYSVASICSEKANIYLDIREYDNYKIRGFELEKIIKDSSVHTLTKIKNLRFYDISRKIFHLIQKINKNESNSVELLSKFGLLYGRRKALLPKKLSGSKAYIYGYFQDANMAWSIREKLKQTLVFPECDCTYNHSGNPRIAVSVRCGKDYMNQGWPICSESYYKAGIEKIKQEKYRDKKVDVLVFSDDIEKAKSMNIDKCATFVMDCSAIEQMSLLRECDDYVISNSSFAWWGAFLGCKENSIVIMPNKWYDTGEDTEDVFLSYKNTMILNAQ